MIRLNASLPVPRHTITGSPTTPVPPPAAVIETLGLWRRSEVSWQAHP
jgi:hypothetical protein